MGSVLCCGPLSVLWHKDGDKMPRKARLATPEERAAFAAIFEEIARINASDDYDEIESEDMPQCGDRFAAIEARLDRIESKLRKAGIR